MKWFCLGDYCLHSLEWHTIDSKDHNISYFDWELGKLVTTFAISRYSNQPFVTGLGKGERNIVFGNNYFQDYLHAVVRREMCGWDSTITMHDFYLTLALIDIYFWNVITFQKIHRKEDFALGLGYDTNNARRATWAITQNFSQQFHANWELLATSDSILIESSVSISENMLSRYWVFVASSTRIMYTS